MPRLLSPVVRSLFFVSSPTLTRIIANGAWYRPAARVSWVEPHPRGVSLGELNWSIVNVTKENEIQTLSEFQKKGGQVLNVLYMHPEEGEFCSYQQAESSGYAATRWVQNVVHSLSEWVSPVSKAKSVRTEKRLSCAAWSSDGVMIALSFPDSSVRVYDTQKQRWSDSVLRLEDPLSVHSIAWKPDSHHTLAVASEQGVLVWDFHTSSEYQVVSALPNALQVTFSPNGEYVLCVCFPLDFWQPFAKATARSTATAR